MTALEPVSGQPRWTYRTRGPVQTRPVLAGNLLFITSNEGRVYALDVRTGAWRWQYEREATDTFSIRGQSSALPVGDRVYVGFPDGYLSCLNAETGEVIWNRPLAGDATRFTDVDGSPALIGDTLVVSCYASGLLASTRKTAACAGATTSRRLGRSPSMPSTVASTSPRRPRGCLASTKRVASCGSRSCPARASCRSRRFGDRTCSSAPHSAAYTSQMPRAASFCSTSPRPGRYRLPPRLRQRGLPAVERRRLLRADQSALAGTSGSNLAGGRGRRATMQIVVLEAGPDEGVADRAAPQQIRDVGDGTEGDADVLFSSRSWWPVGVASSARTV